MKSDNYKQVQQYARDSGRLQAAREFVAPAASIIDRMQDSPLTLSAEGKIVVKFEIDFNEIIDWQHLLSAMKGLAK